MDRFNPTTVDVENDMDVDGGDDGKDGNTKTKHYEHLTILATSEEGWRNLVRINNESQNSFFNKPLMDFDLIKKHSEGRLIVLTGCLGGPVTGPIARSSMESVTLALRHLVGGLGDIRQARTRFEKELEKVAGADDDLASVSELVGRVDATFTEVQAVTELVEQVEQSGGGVDDVYAVVDDLDTAAAAVSSFLTYAGDTTDIVDDLHAAFDTTHPDADSEAGKDFVAAALARILSVTAGFERSQQGLARVISAASGMAHARHGLEQIIDAVGADNVYVELMYQGIEAERKALNGLRRLANEYDLPIVVTGDCHYVDEEDATTHEVWLADQSKRTIDDPKAFKFNGHGYHLKTPMEMRDVHPGSQLWQEGCDNTLTITDRVADWVLPEERIRLPKFPLLPPATPKPPTWKNSCGKASTCATTT